MYDASTERVPDPRYRGMNPNFVKSVWEKRRQEKARLIKTVRQPEPKKKAVAEKIVPITQASTLSVDEILALYRIIVPGQGVYSKPKGKEIIKRVCWENYADVADVLGTSRNRRIVAVRQRAMAEVRKQRPDLHLTDIGRLFNRDHTTVLHALKKMGVWQDTRQAA